MFRILSPPKANYAPPTSSSFNDLDGMEDVLMEDAFNDEDAAGPSRAQTVGKGRVTTPGEVIADSTRWMKGHGTYVVGDQVVASVAGNLERVNKLISVKPLRAKYRPEVGDLVIGRIVEVGPRRWKVEAAAAQNAILMLSSINLPGGVQRRKLESDELQMRNFFKESDLLVCEVQAFFADGAMSLHTRSLKYGKLKNGSLVIVPASLILRLKSHFHTLSYGVDLIIGLNGYIWVSKTINKPTKAEDGEDSIDGFGEESGEKVYSSQNEEISLQTRLAISRTTILISLLGKYCIPISADLITQIYFVSLTVTGETAEGLRSLNRPEVQQKVMKALAAAKAETE